MTPPRHKEGAGTDCARGEQPSFFPPPPSPTEAFSLIEVVLALGVVSFAIVGIMGLFPVAMRAGLESQRETRATHIARQIYADIKAGPPTNTFLATNATPAFRTINLANPVPPTNTVYYNNQGEPVGISETADSEFVVDVIIDPNTPTNGLARVQVNVMAPATASPANRTTNTFVTLMRQD
jgi:uncharacterized protein (TIGR02598 family)